MRERVTPFACLGGICLGMRIRAWREVTHPGWFLIRVNRSRHRKLRAVLLALGDEGADRDVRIATEYPCDQSNPNTSRSGQDRVHAQAFGSRLCSS